MTEPMGMKVILRFSEIAGRFKLEEQVYRNVTEVHWNYPRVAPSFSRHVAIESDVHGTGITWDIDCVAELEVVPETELAEAF